MKKFITAILMFSALCTSCSLEEDPKGYITRESFYQTVEQCKSALRACYTPIHYIYGIEFMMAVEGCTDLWFCGGTNINAQLDITPAKCGTASNVWLYGYKGVARANECVEQIAACPLDDKVKMPMVAEAVALRSLYYYILTCFFGDVPFYTDAVREVAVMDSIRKLPRTSATTIRSILYDDLKENALPYFTESNGLKCRYCDVQDQHAGYALTLILMAKFAMWNSEWDGALYALNLLEDVYGDLDEVSYPLEKTQWRYGHGDECIFEIQHAWDVDGVKFNGAISRLMSPQCAGNWMYDGVYMPYLSETGSTSTPLRATKHYALFRSANNSKTENASNILGIFPAMPMKFTNEVYDFGNNKRYCTVIDMDALKNGVTANGSVLDRRIQYAIGMGNLETGETFESLKSSGFFFGGPKFWCLGMTATYDSNNYPIFRYADAVLMQAECYCELGENGNSMKYLNKTRKRAGLPDYAFSTDSDLLREIQDERARELGGEFHRKFDLVRWGLWYDMTKAFSENNKVINNIRRCHEYYPIPDTECALSGYILTNDAYENL